MLGEKMNKYVPDMYSRDIYNVNYTKLKKQGIKCLLFDLDNTLVEPHVKNPHERLHHFFDTLKKDFQVIIFSNSHEKRLKPFKEKLMVDVNYSSMKPLPFSFYKVLKKYHLKKSEVAIIGDQLLTDIIGGNRVGITTVLIQPITEKDLWITKVNRMRENRKFAQLEKKGFLKRGTFYDEKM